MKADIELQKDNLENLIKQEFELSNGTYGSPRICKALIKKGVIISEATVGRIMKTLRLKARTKRKFKITTDSNHKFKVAKNVLDRGFNVSSLNRVWVSDITYVKAGSKWTYLTVIIDLADRMVIAWNLSNNLSAEDTIIKTFFKALKIRSFSPGLIFHSDRGIQYACDDFRKLLNENNIIQSMSRKGDCWDNAVAESFFKTIKNGMFIQI